MRSRIKVINNSDQRNYSNQNLVSEIPIIKINRNLSLFHK